MAARPPVTEHYSRLTPPPSRQNSTAANDSGAAHWNERAKYSGNAFKEVATQGEFFRRQGISASSVSGKAIIMASSLADDVWTFLMANLGDSGYVVPTAWGSLVTFGIVIWLIRSITSGSSMPKLPIALAETIPNPQERMERWTKDTRRLLQYGYKKVGDPG